MREWVKRIMLRNEIERAKQHAEKYPTTPAGFYSGTTKQQLQTRINYVHLVWGEATRHAHPTAAATNPIRYSMSTLIPIFRLPVQALGPGLRAAGWRRHSVRGGVRTWIPPDAQTMANVNEHARLLLEAQRQAKAARALADPFHAIKQANAYARAAHARAAKSKT
jgi:hypothetical protein